MKKQTAIEWLEQLYDSRPNYEKFILSEEFVKAKQMEQKQIINAYDDASNKICLSCTDFKIGADYYQITYNKEIGKL
jgi:hypothetical protein